MRGCVSLVSFVLMLLMVFGGTEGLEDEFETWKLNGFGDEIVHAGFVAALYAR